MTNSVRTVLQLTLVLGLALGAGACSTIADLDPTGLLGGDSTPAAPDSQFPADTATSMPSDADKGTTPDLAGLPAKPDSSSAADQQQVAQSLAADGAQAHYSGDALRGGTESAAAPPSAADRQVQTSALSSVGAAPSASDLPPTTDAAPATAARPAAPAAAPPPSASPQQSAVQTASLAPAAGAASPAPSNAVAPTAMASMPPPGAQPAVPADTPFRGVTGASAIASDASLGFRPSAAPALNPTISQWVSAPIVARYRQTASNAGITNPTATAAVPAIASRSRGGMGGPEVSGAVVANLDAISSGSAGIAAMNGGVTPTAVIYFPGDGTGLSAAARSEIRGAAQAFKAGGGGGTIRVVGHASSRTTNMPVEKHLELIFNKSQARANAVAQELIRQGVPSDRVLVEAVGDSQPVYYESMPKGEDGNRRAEIFVGG